MKVNLSFKFYSKVLLVIVFFYTLLRICHMLSVEIGAGDENIFIKDLDFIDSFGWSRAIQKGISIPHAILVYPLTLIFQNFIALRLFNLILISIFVYYIYKNFNNKYLWVYFIFFLGNGGGIFLGTNDALFQISLCIFFLEVLKLFYYKTINYNLAFSSLLIAFFTREMIITYLPALVVSFVLIIHYGDNFKIKKFTFPLFILLGFLALNIPSILTNHSLSYDNKTPPKHLNANWVERQYLSQLEVNKGNIENYTHVTWEDVEKYKAEFGENSLPKTSFSALTFDVELTVKEFFKDFLYMLRDSIRQTGFIIIFLFFVLSYKLLNRKLSWESIYAALILFVSFLVFAFIIISYVEMRWLVSVIFVSIVSFSFIQTKLFYKNHFNLFYRINYLLIFILCIYGTYKLFYS